MNRSSLLRDLHHNLTSRRALLELLIRLDGILKLVRRINHSLHLTLRHPRRNLHQIRVRILRHEGLKLVFCAPEETRQEHARHKTAHLRKRHRPAHKLEVAALEQEIVRRLVQVRRRVSDVIDDDGEDLALGAEGRDDVGRLVVDDLVGAEGFAEGCFAGGAGHRHGAAERFRDLDTKCSRAARAAVDEDVVARLDVRRDGLVRRQARRAHGASLLQTLRGPGSVGESGYAVALGDEVLAQGAVASEGVDAADDKVARGDVGDLGADGDGVAGEVHAWAAGEGDHCFCDEA